MKAVIQNRYGDASTLELVEVNKPTPNENELLIEVFTANIASGDMRINTLEVPFGLKTIMRLVFGFKGPRHKIRGISGSGKVVEVGKNVTNYKVNDQVYYINSMKASCMAEFLVLREKAIIAPIPEVMNFETAAPLAFGAMSAYHFINSKSISQNDKVLIYGASGSLGTYAIQLATFFGAEVTAVCSEKNHEVVVALGAKHVIDYTKHDFTDSNKKYDLIFDTVAKLKKADVKASLTSGGKYVSSRTPTSENIGRLLEINKIIEKGGLKTYIDHAYPLDQYREAHEHVYNKHKVGNVVINIKK